MQMQADQEIELPARQKTESASPRTVYLSALGAEENFSSIKRN
jgi:hypothetical protein